MRRTFYTIENERFTGLKKRDISNRREIAFFGLRFFAFIPFCLKKSGFFAFWGSFWMFYPVLLVDSFGEKGAKNDRN